HDQGARGRGHDAAPHDPVPGGGGSSRRPDRGDRRGTRDRRGHALGAEGEARPKRDRALDGGRDGRVPRGTGVVASGSAGAGRHHPPPSGQRPRRGHGGAARARRRRPRARHPHGPRAQPRRRLPPADRSQGGAFRARGCNRTRGRCPMSRTAAIPFTIADERHGLGRIGGAISDAIALWQRNLIGLRRTPQTIVFSTLQPVIFVLLFRYVFGGAVSQTLTVPYVDYLMPGIFCQMVVFGAMLTAVGLAADLKSGMLERFHSLPMSRSAVLAGRTTADLTRNFFVVILVSIAGFIVGFRIHTNVFGFLAGMGLVLLFGYALSWVFATVGLAVG